MVKREALKDIKGLFVIGGQITSRVEAKTDSEKISTIKVLIPKALSNGVINQEELGVLNLKQTIDPLKITRKGTIVMKLSTPYDACLIEEKDEGLLVPSFCTVLDNIPEYLRADYMVAYLNSSACSLQIKRLVAGQIMTIMSTGQLKKVEIPILDLNTQKEIGEKYMENKHNLMLMTKITKLEKEYLDSVIFEMEE